MGADKAANGNLYDRDFYSWALQQARALREHRIEELDWENLAEEVGDLARSERRALTAHCATLIEHLLKIALAPDPVVEHNRRLWDLTVKAARRKIRRLLEENPGLKSSVQQLFEEAWMDGRDEALKFLDCGEELIGEVPLWGYGQAMDDNFSPGRAA